MSDAFLRATPARFGKPVFRLGLSATYRPGKKTIYQALDAGVNYLFAFGIDTQMTAVLRDVLRRDRERYVVGTGAYNYIWWAQDIRRTLDKRLRQLQTDYIDVFHFLGIMKPAEYTDEVRRAMEALRGDPRVRSIAISTHDRKLAGQLAADGALDALMIRYNAAHRGAESEIFPFVARHGVAVVSYTSTRWRFLMRAPRGWPKDKPVPDAGMAYRFVLSNPAVDVCLSAPSNARQFEENLAAVGKGPLSEEEMVYMRDFGDAVHRQYKYFM